VTQGFALGYLIWPLRGRVRTTYQRWCGLDHLAEYWYVAHRSWWGPRRPGAIALSRGCRRADS